MPSADVLARNILTTFNEVGVQVAHAQSVKTRARTGYYTASIVEALVYDLIESKCKSDPTLLRNMKSERLKKLHELHPTKHSGLGLTKTLWVSEVVVTDFDLSKSDFKAMNDFCRKNRLVSPRLYAKLDYTRKKRNEIHLQGLATSQRKYNAKILDRVSAPMIELLDLT